MVLTPSPIGGERLLLRGLSPDNVLGDRGGDALLDSEHECEDTGVVFGNDIADGVLGEAVADDFSVEGSEHGGVKGGSILTIGL